MVVFLCTVICNRCRAVGCLSFPPFFHSRVVFLYFSPCLVSMLFTGPSLLVVNIYRKFFTLVVFELCLMKKKKESKKNGIFTLGFLKFEKGYWNSGSIFYSRVAKSFHL